MNQPRDGKLLRQIEGADPFEVEANMASDSIVEGNWRIEVQSKRIAGDHDWHAPTPTACSLAHHEGPGVDIDAIGKWCFGHVALNRRERHLEFRRLRLLEAKGLSQCSQVVSTAAADKKVGICWNLR